MTIDYPDSVPSDYGTSLTLWQEGAKSCGAPTLCSTAQIPDCLGFKLSSGNGRCRLGERRVHVSGVTPQIRVPDGMTFAHYDFKGGSFIHEHSHPQEEVYEVIEGELELTIDGVKQVARPGLVGIVPSNVRHSVKALTDGRAILVDYPLRTEIGDRRS